MRAGGRDSEHPSRRVSPNTALFHPFRAETAEIRPSSDIVTCSLPESTMFFPEGTAGDTQKKKRRIREGVGGGMSVCLRENPDVCMITPTE
jgi:hypothetical protein